MCCISNCNSSKNRVIVNKQTIKTDLINLFSDLDWRKFVCLFNLFPFISSSSSSRSSMKYEIFYWTVAEMFHFLSVDDMTSVLRPFSDCNPFHVLIRKKNVQHTFLVRGYLFLYSFRYFLIGKSQKKKKIVWIKTVLSREIKKAYIYIAR